MYIREHGDKKMVHVFNNTQWQTNELFQGNSASNCKKTISLIS